jgi:hypothetical protein
VTARYGESLGRDRKIAGRDVVIRMTKTGRGHFDQELSLARRFELELDDFPFAGCGEQDGRFGQHEIDLLGEATDGHRSVDNGFGMSRVGIRSGAWQNIYLDVNVCIAGQSSANLVGKRSDRSEGRRPGNGVLFLLGRPLDLWPVTSYDP